MYYEMSRVSEELECRQMLFGIYIVYIALLITYQNTLFAIAFLQQVAMPLAAPYLQQVLAPCIHHIVPYHQRVFHPHYWQI